MSDQGWAAPTGSGASRFAEPVPTGPTSTSTAEPYGAPPSPGGPPNVPYGVADLPWAWTGGSGTTTTPSRVGTHGLGQFPGTEHVDLAATLRGPGYEGRPPRTDGVAVAALVVGLLGLIPWVGIGAIILGHVALYRLSQDPYVGGRGLALTGAVLGYLTVGFHLLLELFFSTLGSLF